MRNKPTLLLLILFSLGLIQKLFPQTATVTPDNFNVFYKGVDNPITVVVENCPCKDVVVKPSVGYIYGKGCHYYYKTRSDTTSTEVKIYVGELKGNDTNWIETIDYRLHLVPDPTPYIGNLEGGWIAKDLLCISGGITPRHSFGDFSYTVTSYSIKISRNDSVLFKFENYVGPKFENDFIKFIKENCISNDDLVFYNIIAMGKDGLHRKLTEMRFRMK